MQHRLPDLRDARGFTMLELLVVILIVGILATIGLPAFLGQRARGHDTNTKAMLKTTMVALRTFELDHATFAATRADLEVIEPTIANASADFAVTGTVSTFVLSERSESGTEFTLTRDASGRVTRDCSQPGEGSCNTALDASGNRW